MTRDQLIQALRKYARKRGIAFELDKKMGKGSHYMVTVGAKTFTLQKNLTNGDIRRFLKQIGVDPADL